MNAGTGEFSRFVDTTFAEKSAFLQMNALQYVECADYFSKLFVRERSGLRSGLVFTSSLWAHFMTTYRSLYCVSKAFVSDLAQQLWAELRCERCKIDVLAVCPTTIRGTGFHRAPGMCPSGTPLQFFGKQADEGALALDPARVVRAATRNLGLRCEVSVGLASHACALARGLGRNFGAWAGSLAPGWDAMVKK